MLGHLGLFADRRVELDSVPARQTALVRWAPLCHEACKTACSTTAATVDATLLLVGPRGGLELGRRHIELGGHLPVGGLDLVALGTGLYLGELPPRRGS